MKRLLWLVLGAGAVILLWRALRNIRIDPNKAVVHIRLEVKQLGQVIWTWTLSRELSGLGNYVSDYLTIHYDALNKVLNVEIKTPYFTVAELSVPVRNMGETPKPFFSRNVLGFDCSAYASMSYNPLG